MTAEQLSHSVRPNIRKLYVLFMTRGALFLSPIAVPFFMAQGLSLAHVFYLQSAATFTIMMLEIPSGYLSDRWGRKYTLILGSVFGILGIMMYVVSAEFWGFFVGNICLAILVSCHSGTIEAMTYDTLLELGESENYRKTLGHQLFWYLLTQSAVSVVGGILATISLRTPVYATIIPFVLGLLIVLTLREPSRQKLQETRHFTAIWRITKTSLVQNVPLRSMIVLHAVLSSIILSLVWFAQPYQTLVGLPLALFGLAHAALTVGGAFAAKMTHRAKQWVDDRLLLVLVATLLVICYLGLGLAASRWAIIFFFLGSSTFGVLNVLVGDIMNKIATSDIRATVLSVQQFAFRTVFAIVAPLLGYLTGILSLTQTLFYVGIGSGLAVLVIFIAMRRVWKELPS